MCESTPGYVQWSQFQMIARDAEVQMVFAGAAAIAFDSTTAHKAVKRTTVGGRRMNAVARRKAEGIEGDAEQDREQSEQHGLSKRIGLRSIVNRIKLGRIRVPLVRLAPYDYKESLEFAADQNDMMRLSRIHVQSLSCAQ